MRADSADLRLLAITSNAIIASTIINISIYDIIISFSCSRSYCKWAALFVRLIIPPKSSLIGFIYGGLLK